MSTSPQPEHVVDEEKQALLARIEKLEQEIEQLRQAPQRTHENALHLDRSTSPLSVAALLDAFPMGIGLLDRDCRFIAVNRELAALHGIPAEQHVGRQVDEVVPFLADQIREMVRTVVETGRPVTDQELISGTVKNPDEVAHWSIVSFPLPGPGNGVLGAGAMVTNISERKRIEQALRQSESALAVSNRTIQRQLGEIEALYAATRAGIALVDPELRFVRINERLAQINGVPIADSVGKPVAEVVPALWPQIERYFRKVIETRQPVHAVEIRGYTNTEPGVEHIWHVDYDPVSDAPGRFIGVSVFVNDMTGERRAQEVLEESIRSANLRLAEIEAIYESAPVGLCVFDDQLRFTRVNHRVAQINGIASDAHIGKKVHDVVPDFADQAESALRRLIETGEPWLDFEMSGRAPDGRLRYWNNRWVPLKDHHGHVIGASVAIEETTNRHNALEALRQSERLYRAIGESLDWGIWICEPDGRNVYASESILKLIGQTQEECRDYGWVDRLHPDDADRVRSQWSDCVRREGKWDVEFRFRGIDGLDYPVLVRGVPVRDESGRILCWAGINLDVRRLKETETALKQQVAEFEALFRALPVGVGVSRDPGCELVKVNPAFAAMLGISSEENASKSRPDAEVLPFRVFQDGKEVAPEDLAMQVAARTGREVRNFVHDVVRADGMKLTEYVNAVPLTDVSGKVVGSLGVFMDITELTQAQRELERVNAELRRVNEDLNQFAFAAAHDLQEPMRMITVYSELLAKGWAAGDQQRAAHAAGIMSEGAHRMQELLRDLLAYLQVATRGEQISEPVDLNAVFENVTTALAVTIAETGASISADRLPIISGHRLHFVHLFQNQIENAIKYRRASPPEIRISANRFEDGWRFGVADNGMGIEPEYQSTVFGLFKRLHGRDIPGTGIGLAICQRVVESYGGRIWVESTTGSGSTFYFTIPLWGDTVSSASDNR